MCCSASQWICSSSSAGVIAGIVIFLMITECPDARSATSRPFAVSESSSRRASSGDRPRRISPASTRRVTTADTLLWWVCVAAARSFSDSDARSASVRSTNVCAPLSPTWRSAARDDSRSACTMPRMAFSTSRVAAGSARRNILAPIRLIIMRVSRRRNAS